MLPILLSLGPVIIYSYGIVLSIGLFLGLYWWWKMGRDEHYDEISLFDGYFLSLVIFLVAGRLGYVFLHFADLGTLYRTLALLAFPGISVISGAIVSVVFLLFFARAQAWDQWKVLDSLVVVFSLISIFGGIAGLFNGSNPGRVVSWGLVYPGQKVPRIPVDVWIFLWALATFGVVSSVRKNFRFYAWYKAEASVVREGLATLIFGVSLGVYYLVIPWLEAAPWKWQMIPDDAIVGILILFFSTYLIYRRVGRKTSAWAERLREVKLNLLQWVRHIRRE